MTKEKFQAALMLHFIYTIKAASGPHILLFLVCGIATLYRIWSKGIRKNFFEDGGVHKTCSCEGTNGPWGRLSSFIRSHEATLAESKPPLFMDWLPPLYTFGTWSSDRQEKHKKLPQHGQFFDKMTMYGNMDGLPLL